MTAQTAGSMQGVVGWRLSASTVLHWFWYMGLHSRQPFRGNNLTVIRLQNGLKWIPNGVSNGLQRQCAEVLFTNESHSPLSGSHGCIYMWWWRGERFANLCVLEADRWGGGSAMVRNGHSFRHRIPLIVFDATYSHCTALHQWGSAISSCTVLFCPLRCHSISAGWCPILLCPSYNCLLTSTRHQHSSISGVFMWLESNWTFVGPVR